MFLSLVSNYHQFEGLIPSGKRLHNYGKSPCSMGKSIISMVIFHSYFDITRGYVPTKTANHIVNPRWPGVPTLRQGDGCDAAWLGHRLSLGFPQFVWRVLKWEMEKSWGNHEKMMGKSWEYEKWLANDGRIYRFIWNRFMGLLWGNDRCIVEVPKCRCFQLSKYTHNLNQLEKSIDCIGFNHLPSQWPIAASGQNHEKHAENAC